MDNYFESTHFTSRRPSADLSTDMSGSVNLVSWFALCPVGSGALVSVLVSWFPLLPYHHHPLLLTSQLSEPLGIAGQSVSLLFWCSKLQQTCTPTRVGLEEVEVEILKLVSCSATREQ